MASRNPSERASELASTPSLRSMCYACMLLGWVRGSKKIGTCVCNIMHWRRRSNPNFPFPFLLFRLNHRLCSGDSRCFHATNLLLHCLVTFLISKISLLLSTPLRKTRRKGGGKCGNDDWQKQQQKSSSSSSSSLLPLLASLLFAVHPIHTEAVSRKNTYVCREREEKMTQRPS